MEPFEIIMTIINAIAVITIPIIAVIIGQYLQNRSEKRKDKLFIFKTLMISRNGWTPESVRALNIIDIVFADDKNVRARWKEYYDKLCVENPTETELKKIKTAQDKLLEAMAVSLGYKDKVTWETIQNPYIPKGMVDAEQMQREYQNGQLAMAKIAEQVNVALSRYLPDSSVSRHKHTDSRVLSYDLLGSHLSRLNKGHRLVLPRGMNHSRLSILNSPKRVLYDVTDAVHHLDSH